jgi:hypothetical protein
MTSIPSAVGKAAAAALEIGEASALTIGFRMPILVSIPLWPQHDAVLEAHRMVTEKVAAVTEGMAAAWQQAAALATCTLLGRAEAGEMAAGFLIIATAAARPAGRRARANATRLSTFRD